MTKTLTPIQMQLKEQKTPPQKTRKLHKALARTVKVLPKQHEKDSNVCFYRNRNAVFSSFLLYLFFCYSSSIFKIGALGGWDGRRNVLLTPASGHPEEAKYGTDETGTDDIDVPGVVNVGGCSSVSSSPRDDNRETPEEQLVQDHRTEVAKSGPNAGIDEANQVRNTALVAEFGRTKVFKFMKWHLPVHFEDGGLLYLGVAKDLDYNTKDESQMAAFKYLWGKHFKEALKSSLTNRRSTVSENVRERLKGIPSIVFFWSLLFLL